MARARFGHCCGMVGAKTQIVWGQCWDMIGAWSREAKQGLGMVGVEHRVWMGHGRGMVRTQFQHG